MTRSIDSFFHLTRITMNAITEIRGTYSVEDFKEIANHGCQSGVCTQHIYYGDTLEFYETYEDEIVEYIRDAYGTGFLVEMFQSADASLTHYKNNVTWCFIEMVAMEALEEIDDEVYAYA